MLKCVKKNKEIILSSSIFIGISYLNTFGKYCENKCRSGKGDKNITNNNNSNNSNNDDQAPDSDKDHNKKPGENPDGTPDGTPDPDKDSNGDKPKEDPLKPYKETLKKFLNSVIENNNNLEVDDRFKIDITPENIDSKDKKKDLDQIKNYLDNISNQIIQKTAEKDQEKAKEILRNECLKLFDECENLNSQIPLGLDTIDLTIKKTSIENEQDINNLKKYKIILDDKKEEFKILKEKLLKEIEKSNKKLKEVIQLFYENKVVKTEYDDEIEKEGITFKELHEINVELNCIFKNFIHSKNDYEYVYYEDLKNEFHYHLNGYTHSIFNEYRIMYILSVLINTIDCQGVSKYVFAKNENEDIDPFTSKETGYNDEIFYIFLKLLQDANFSNTIILFMKNFDGNSYIANEFKLKFFSNSSRKAHWKLEYYLVPSYIINNFLTLMYKNERDKFLVNNQITLGDKLNQKELFDRKFTNLKELNDFIYPIASKIVTDDKLKEKK